MIDPTELSSIQRELAKLRNEVEQRKDFAREYKAAVSAAQSNLLGKDDLGTILMLNSALSPLTAGDIPGSTTSLSHLNKIAKNNQRAQRLGSRETREFTTSNSTIDATIDIARTATARFADALFGMGQIVAGSPLAGMAGNPFAISMRAAQDVPEDVTDTGPQDALTRAGRGIREPRPLITRLSEEAKAGVLHKLGVPIDPLERAHYKQSLPLSEKTAAFLVEMAAWYFVRVGPASTVGEAATATKGAAGMLARAMPGFSQAGKRVFGVEGRRVGLVAAGVGGTAGGAISYGTQALHGVEDVDYLQVAQDTAAGAALGYFFATLMLGRPFGIQAQKYHKAIGEAQFGRFRAPNFGNNTVAGSWGAAHAFSPRLTVGYMLESGALGAGFGTLDAIDQGKPTFDAILEGARTAPLWMMGDIAMARLGSTARWAAHASSFRTALESNLADLAATKVGKFATALQNPRGREQVSAGAQAVANIGGGAAIGATAAAMGGQDPRVGAIAGALAGTRISFMSRVRPLLPTHIVEQIMRGEFNKLSPHAAQTVAQLAVRDAMEQVITGVDPATEVILRRLVAQGADLSVDELRRVAGLKAEATKLYREIDQLAPNQVLPREEALLFLVLSRARRLMEIREIESQMLRVKMVPQMQRGRQAGLFPDGVPDRAQVFTRAKETRRIAQFADDASVRLESVQAQNQQAAQNVRAQIYETAKSVNVARATAREAESLVDFKTQVDEIVNSQISVARGLVDDMPIARVYDEIAKATGETAEQAARRVGEPFATPRLGRHLENPAAREELAALRAATGNPRAAITKPVHRREGLTSDIRQDILNFERMHAHLDDLLARNDVGDRITAEDVRGMLRLFGKGKVSGKTGGVLTIEFPYVGTITDLAPAALRRAKMMLKDFKPALALSTVAMGTSLSKADGIVASPGFLEFRDEDGKDGYAWLPTAAAVASFATLGIVLRKGFPIRIQGFAKLAREFLKRQEIPKIRAPARRRLKMAGRRGLDKTKLRKTPREALVTLLSDGEGFILGGETGTIQMRPVDKLRDGRGIVFSLHNHPIYSAADVVGELPRAIRLGERHVNKYPSSGDLLALERRLPVGVDDVLFGIITPVEGTFTLVHSKRRTAGRFTSAFETHDMRTSVDMMAEGLGLAPATIELAKLDNNAYLAMAGKFVEARGEAALHDILTRLYTRRGITVLHDIPDAAIDRVFRDAAQRGFPIHDAVSKAIAAESHSYLSSPSTSAGAKLAYTPDFRAAVVKLLTGAPPARQVQTPRTLSQAARETRAILPESVTPTEVSKPALSLPGAREWAARHGLEVQVNEIDGRRVFQTVGEGGEVLAESITIRDMIGQIARLARDRKNMVAEGVSATGIKPGDAGFVARGLGELGMVAGWSMSGGVIGSMLGIGGASAIEALFRDPDDYDKNYGIVGVGAVMGLASGMIAGAALGRFIVNARGQQILKLVKPATEDLLTEAQVNRMIGKSSTSGRPATKTKPAVKAGGGPTEKNFVLFPIKAQIEHLRKRVSAAVNESNKTLEGKQKNLHNAMRKFAPVHIPSEDWTTLQNEMFAAGKSVGLTDNQAHQLWLGMLAKSVVPFTERGGQRSRHQNLFFMAESDGTALFGPNADLDRIRSVYEMSEVMSGLPGVAPALSARAAQLNFARSLLTESKVWQTIRRVSDREPAASAVGPEIQTNRGGVLGLLVQGLRSPEMFHSVGTRMFADPNLRSRGERILRLHQAVYTGATSMQAEGKEWTSKLYRALGSLSEDELLLIHELAQDPVRLQQALIENPVLAKAAVGWNTLFTDIADSLQIPHQFRKENYFAWIYNQRTLETLRAKKYANPQEMFIPNNIGALEHKVFRHFLPRATDAPLGEYEKNPLLVGQMYINAAMRKKYIDRIIAEFPSEWWDDFAHVDPFMASDMSRWFLDVAGVPTTAQIRTLMHLRNIGMRVEALGEAAAKFGFNTSSFVQEIGDRYFLGRGVPGNFSRMIRGFEFVSKIGGSLISPLVNLSQIANTATDMGLGAILIGTADFGLGALAGKISQGVRHPAGRIGRAAGAIPGIRPLTGWVSLKAGGPQKLRVAQKIGIWSDSLKRSTDAMHDITAMHRETGLGTVVGASVAGGFASAAAFGEEGEPKWTPFWLGSAVGAAMLSNRLVGAKLQKHNTRIFRHSLQTMKKTLVAPFSMVEVLLRTTTAGAAQQEAKRAVRLAGASPAALRRAKAFEVGESTVLFGGAAGAAGFATEDEEGERFSVKRAATFAGLGAAAGAGVGLASKPRFMRVAGELDNVRDTLSNIPFRRQLKNMGPPTVKEVEMWYMRQVLDQTQFRFGREGRAALLRSTTGEILGSLQSFTINQMEFVGARVQAFAQSLAHAMPSAPRLSPTTLGQLSQLGGKDLVKALSSGQLDLRFFRYLALVAGTGGALTALTAGLIPDKDFNYWTSRIGFGLLPMLFWNEDAETWQLGDIMQHLGGPFLSDVHNATQAAWHLLTDPLAQKRFDEQIDGLSQQVFSVMRQVQTNVEITGRALDLLHAEGMADMIRNQQGLVDAVANPLGFLRGTGGSGRGGAGSGGTGGFSDGSGFGSTGF